MPVDEPDGGRDAAAAAAERRLHRGRWKLGGHIGLVLATSAVTITAYNLYGGPGRLRQQVVRFGLTALMMFYLWRGSGVARWLSVVLLGSGGSVAWMVVMSDGAPRVCAVCAGIGAAGVGAGLRCAPTVGAGGGGGGTGEVELSRQIARQPL